jgi:hypothetical protein
MRPELRAHAMEHAERALELRLRFAHAATHFRSRAFGGTPSRGFG